MKKIVRLTESDLTRIVRRVLKENVDDEKLNKILDKITEYGMESLTKQELLYLDISSTNVGGKEVLTNKNNLSDKIIKSIKKPYFKDLIKTKVPKEYWGDIFSKIFNQKVTIQYDKGGATNVENGKGQVKIPDGYHIKDKNGEYIYSETPDRGTWESKDYDENKNTMLITNNKPNRWRKYYGWFNKKGEKGKWTFLKTSDGYWESKDYDENGKFMNSQSSDGRWVDNKYDENGRLIYRNVDGIWIKSEYDENGNSTFTQSSDGTWSKYKYDENGNMIYRETLKPDGTIYKWEGEGDEYDDDEGGEQILYSDEDEEGEEWKKNLYSDDDEYDDDEYDDDEYDDDEYDDDEYDDDDDINPKRLKDIPFANWQIKNSEGKYYNHNYGNPRWEDDIWKSSTYPYNDAKNTALSMKLKDFKIVHGEDERKK